MEDLKKELIGYALDIANKFDITLDFSNESIKDVETILDVVHSEYIITGNEEGLYGIALEFGLYIIEVIERNFSKGILERNHEEYGENTYPFYWDNQTLFPYIWCLKRIYDGETDNVWIKYKSLVLRKKRNIFGLQNRTKR